MPKKLIKAPKTKELKKRKLTKKAVAVDAVAQNLPTFEEVFGKAPSSSYALTLSESQELGLLDTADFMLEEMRDHAVAKGIWNQDLFEEVALLKHFFHSVLDLYHIKIQIRQADQDIRDEISKQIQNENGKG